MRSEDGDLPFELKDGAVNEGLLEEKGGIVGREAGGEIIGAIKDSVVGGKEVETVVRLEAAFVEHDLDMWIDLVESGLSALHFGRAYPIGVVNDLAVEV